MHVTNAYKFIRFGAMDVTKPYKFIWFGAMHVTLPTPFLLRGTRASRILVRSIIISRVSFRASPSRRINDELRAGTKSPRALPSLPPSLSLNPSLLRGTRASWILVRVIASEVLARIRSHFGSRSSRDRALSRVPSSPPCTFELSRVPSRCHYQGMQPPRSRPRQVKSRCSS